MDGTIHFSPRQKLHQVLQPMILYMMRLPGLAIIDLITRFLISNDQQLHKNLHSTIVQFQNDIHWWTTYSHFTTFLRSRNFDTVLENVLIGSSKKFMC